MKSKLFIKLLLLAALLLVLSITATTRARTLTAITAQDVSTDQTVPSGGTVSISISPEQQAAAIAMWTREARMAAQPMDILNVSLDEAEEEQPLIPDAPAVPDMPGFSPGGLPAPGANVMAQQQFPEEWSRLDEVTADESPQTDAAHSTSLEGSPLAAMGTKQVFSRYRANFYHPMWRRFPYVAIGKLYFQTAAGQDSCTASVVRPNNIIVTAAHCVYDTTNNIWFNNFVFVPAERDFATPYGSFPAETASILPQWINLSGRPAPGWLRHDVALLTLGRNAANQLVTRYTGWLGLSWNFPAVQHHFTFGYPVNFIDGEQYTYICVAESFWRTTDTIGMGCDMEGGSSGGPWILAFTPYEAGALNFVNAVISAGLGDGANTYGPAFTSRNIEVLCNLEGC